MRRAGQAGQARERALDALLDQGRHPAAGRTWSTRRSQPRRQSLDDRLERSGTPMDELPRGRRHDGRASSTRSSPRTRGVASRPGSSWTSWRPTKNCGVDQDELAAYVTEQAYRMGVAPDRLAKELVRARASSARSSADVLRSKALTLIAERASVTDEAGRAGGPQGRRRPRRAAEADGDGGRREARRTRRPDERTEAADEADAGAAAGSTPRRGGRAALTTPGAARRRPPSRREACAYSEQARSGGLPGPGRGLWSLSTTSRDCQRRRDKT